MRHFVALLVLLLGGCTSYGPTWDEMCEVSFDKVDVQLHEALASKQLRAMGIYK